MKMIFDGSQVVALEDGEIPPFPITSNFKDFIPLQTQFTNITGVLSEITKTLAFFHHSGKAVGSESLKPENILLVKSSEGIKVILSKLKSSD